MVAPIILTAAQVQVLLNAIANTGLMSMPAGYSLAQLNAIHNIRPDTSPTNVGGVIISGITLNPTPTPTVAP